MKDQSLLSDSQIDSTTASTATSPVGVSPVKINGAMSPISSSIKNGVGESTIEYMETDAIEEASTTSYPEKHRNVTMENVIEKIKRPLERGETWYCISKKWIEDFCIYQQSRLESDNPGPIDNSSLLIQRNKLRLPEPVYGLKANLTEDIDFVPLPEEAWNFFISTFKTVNGIGSNPIRCEVVETSPDYFVLEYHLLEVRLVQYGNKNDSVLYYSRNLLIKDLIGEMRRVFRIPDDREVQLWHNATLIIPHPDNAASSSSSNSNAISSTCKIPVPPPPPPSSPSGSAQTSPPPPPPPPPPPLSTSKNPTTAVDMQTTRLIDLSLDFTNLIFTIEVQNMDGTWPSSRTKLGAITRSKVLNGAPITDPGLCGLMNLGNTCFMNSALQCLANTPPLTEYLLSDRYLDEINYDNPLGMSGEIARRFAELVKGIWSGHYNTLTPRDFKMVVGRFAPQFSGFAQHDCQELMAFLLDGLHEDLNRVKNKPYIEAKNDIEKRPDDVVAAESWVNYKRRNDSIIVDTFHSQLKSTLVCPECEMVSVTFDPFCYLSLPLPYKRERAVEIVFIPAISKRPLHPAKNNYTFVPFSKYMDDENRDTNYKMLNARSILIPHVMIPKIGCISDISNCVAKTLNDSLDSQGRPALGRTVDPSKLRVANVYMNRMNKIYNTDESYSMHFEDIVVYEEDDIPVGAASTIEPACQTRSVSTVLKQTGHILPVFIREVNANSGEISVSRPFLICIKKLVFEDAREAIFQELLSILINPDDAELFLQAMNETPIPVEKDPKLSTTPKTQETSDGETSEMDDDESKTNKSSTDEPEEGATIDEEEEDAPNHYNTRSRNNVPIPPFTISVVNMFATNEISVLQPGCRIDSAVSSFLAVNINTKIVYRFLSRDMNAHRQLSLQYLLPSTASNPMIQPRTSITLGECINTFTLQEKLGCDDPWYCPRCKKHQMASKKFDIWSLPNILIIHLKRFSYSRLHRDKLDILVEFPIQDLDMTPYVLHNPKNDSFKYDLIAVANHFGGLGGGHYTAYAKNANKDQWFNFDDSSVMPQNAQSVVTKSAYVLFYQRKTNANVTTDSTTTNYSSEEVQMNGDSNDVH